MPSMKNKVCTIVHYNCKKIKQKKTETKIRANAMNLGKCNSIY